MQFSSAIPLTHAFLEWQNMEFTLLFCILKVTENVAQMRSKYCCTNHQKPFTVDCFDIHFLIKRGSFVQIGSIFDEETDQIPTTVNVLCFRFITFSYLRTIADTFHHILSVLNTFKTHVFFATSVFRKKSKMKPPLQ